MNLDELLKRLLGSVSNKVSAAGNALGNPLPEYGLTEKGEVLGASAMSTPERIATSIKNTGGIAEGDYTTAQNLGYSPYTPSRADGGILTPQQNKQNIQTTTAAVNVDKNNLDALIDTPTGRKTGRTVLEETGGTGVYTTGGSSGPDFAELLRRAKEEGLRSLGAARDEALRYGQEARGLLGKRKSEFTDMFNEAGNTILTTTEKNRGELQRADQESTRKARNNLSVMGLGGSALERLYGRQKQAQARGLGELSAMRDTNDSANRKQYNSNNDWANTQESAIGASERAANDRYQSGVATSENNFGSALGTLLSNIQAQSAALANAREAANGYKAPSYSVTGMNPNALIQNLQTTLGGMGLMGGTNPAVDNAGISISQNPTYDQYNELMRRKAAGAVN
jgi:hypothetical protein